jgi:hydroxymethylbilane synthase
MAREIVVGTRDSALALWQTNWVVESLKALNPEINFRIVEMKTQGDKILDVALAKIGDKGLFTKELEVAMIDRTIDFAVHSMKDLPTKLPEGLKIGAICERYEPGDVVISHKGYTLANLPHGAKVGTSSLRRKAQLLKYRPDVNIQDLRGNLNTRLAKLEREDFDAIILAAAGIERLGWKEKITERIDYNISLPAVGQGSIGIEIRENDEFVQEVVGKLNHDPSQIAITGERALLRKLEGGCQIPIGSLGVVDGDNLTLHGVVASLDGKQLLRAQISGNIEEAEVLGIQLAENLIAMGADEILKQVRLENA